MSIRRRKGSRRAGGDAVVEKLMELAAGALALRLGSWQAAADRLDAAAKIARGRRDSIDPDTTGTRDLAGVEASKLIWQWYITPEYVDDSGRPRPMKLWGAAPSIEALALANGIPRTDLAARMAFINEVEGLHQVRKGVFVPVRQTLMVTDNQAAMRRRGEKLYLRMTETLVHNTSERDRSAREFERSVHVARLDKAQIPAFRRFLDGQGRAFVEAVDFWLEKRQTAIEGEGAEVLVEIFSRVTPSHDRVPGKRTKATATGNTSRPARAAKPRRRGST